MMLLLLLPITITLLSTNINSYQLEEDIQFLVYKGKLSRTNEFPHSVAIIQYKENSEGTQDIFFVCGGNLINDEAIITAGHCASKFYHLLNNGSTTNEINDVKGYGAIIGSVDLQKRENDALYISINRIIIHEKYVENMMTYGNERADLGYDFAMMFLNENVYENGVNIRYANIRKNEDLEEEKEEMDGEEKKESTVELINKYSEISGFGETDKGVWNFKLYNADFKIHKDCTDKILVPKGMDKFLMCGNPVFCAGDSGSGIVTVENIEDLRYSLVGIVSYNLFKRELTDEERYCGTEGIVASVCVKVEPLREWIFSKTHEPIEPLYQDSLYFLKEKMRGKFTWVFVLILIIAIVVLLLLIGISIIFFFIKKRFSKKNNDSNSKKDDGKKVEKREPEKIDDNQEQYKKLVNNEKLDGLLEKYEGKMPEEKVELVK